MWHVHEPPLYSDLIEDTLFSHCTSDAFRIFLCHNDKAQASLRLWTASRRQRKKAHAAIFAARCLMKSRHAEICIFTSFSPAIP